MKLKIYKKGKKYKDSDVVLRLEKMNGQVYLVVVDGYGAKRSGGHILFINKNGVTRIPDFRGDGLSVDQQNKINDVPHGF